MYILTNWPMILFINSCFNILNLGKNDESFIFFKQNRFELQYSTNNKYCQSSFLKSERKKNPLL